MLSKREQLMFFLAVAVLGLFVLNKIVLAPISNAINQTRQERDTLAADVEAMYDLIDRRPTMRRRWQEMQEEGLNENPSLVEQQVFQNLDQWSADNGVTLSSMTPSYNSVEVGFPSITFNVAGKGDLEGVCRLVHQLEQTSFPVCIQSLTLGSTNSQGQDMKINMKLNVPYIDPSIPLTEESLSL